MVWTAVGREADGAIVASKEADVARLYEHGIAIVVGKAPAAFSLPMAPLDLKPQIVPISLSSELLQRRPDIAAAERRVAEANEQIGIAEAAYYPSVTFNGLGGFEGNNITNWFSWPSLFWAVGLSVGEALFDGGRRHAQSAATLASYDAAVADYRQTTLSAFQQVEDNLATLRILGTGSQAAGHRCRIGGQRASHLHESLRWGSRYLSPGRRRTNDRFAERTQ